MITHDEYHSLQSGERVHCTGLYGNPDLRASGTLLEKDCQGDWVVMLDAEHDYGHSCGGRMDWGWGSISAIPREVIG